MLRVVECKPVSHGCFAVARVLLGFLFICSLILNPATYPAMPYLQSYLAHEDNGQSRGIWTLLGALRFLPSVLRTQFAPALRVVGCIPVYRPSFTVGRVLPSFLPINYFYLDPHGRPCDAKPLVAFCL